MIMFNNIGDIRASSTNLYFLNQHGGAWIEYQIHTEVWNDIANPWLKFNGTLTQNLAHFI